MQTTLSRSSLDHVWLRLTWLALIGLLVTLPLACSSAADASGVRERERLRTEVAALTRELTGVKSEVRAAGDRIHALEREADALRARITTLDQASTVSRIAAAPSAVVTRDGEADAKLHASSAIGPIPLPLAIATTTVTSPAPQTAKSAEPVLTPTVYVTASGSKYHTATCRYAGSGRPVPLSEAVIGNEPCKVCRPPGRESLEANASGQAAKLVDVPPTPKATPTIASGRCAATTQKGARCKRNAGKGSSFCWQHGR